MNGMSNSVSMEAYEKKTSKVLSAKTISVTEVKMQMWISLYFYEGHNEECVS